MPAAAKIIIGVAIGGLLGFIYHKKIGCASGACPLTSTALGSILSFAVMGLMVGSAI